MCQLRELIDVLPDRPSLEGTQASFSARSERARACVGVGISWYILNGSRLGAAWEPRTCLSVRVTRLYGCRHDDSNKLGRCTALALSCTPPLDASSPTTAKSN